MRESSATAVVESPPLPGDESIIARAIAWIRRTPLWPLFSVTGVGVFQILAMAATLLRSKIVAVSLGPTGVGAIALLDQIVLLGSQVCVFGMAATATKFLSAAHSDGEDTFAHAYWTFFRVTLLLSLIGAVGTALFLEFRPPAGITGVAVIAALAIVPLNGVAVIQNAMAASRRVRAAATYGLVSTVLVCGLSAAATAATGLGGYYVATLVALAATLAGGIWYMRGVHDPAPWFRSPLADLQRYRSAVGAAAVLYVASLSAPLADLVPRYVMARAHSLEATGLLQAAFGLALAVRSFVRPSLGLFLTPTLNRRTPPDEKLREAASFMRVMMALATMLALVIVLFPELWLSILYTQKFVGVAPWVYLFLTGVAVQLIGSVYVQLLFALDELRGFVVIAVSADLLTCAVTALLVPRFGIPAVAVGLMANGVVLCVASGWLLRRRYRLNVARAVGALPAIAILAIVAVGIMVPAGPVTVASAVMRVAVLAAAAVGLLASLRRTSSGILHRL